MFLLWRFQQRLDARLGLNLRHGPWVPPGGKMPYCTCSPGCLPVQSEAGKELLFNKDIFYLFSSLKLTSRAEDQTQELITHFSKQSSGDPGHGRGRVEGYPYCESCASPIPWGWAAVLLCTYQGGLHSSLVVGCRPVLIHRLCWPWPHLHSPCLSLLFQKCWVYVWPASLCPRFCREMQCLVSNLRTVEACLLQELACRFPPSVTQLCYFQAAAVSHLPFQTRFPPVVQASHLLLQLWHWHVAGFLPCHLFLFIFPSTVEFMESFMFLR